MSKKYDATYFIKKFEAIPEELWTMGIFGEDGQPHCAQGHCGVRNWDSRGWTSEARALNGLLSLLSSPVKRRVATNMRRFNQAWYTQYLEFTYGWAADINNGHHPGYPQPTPKQRVLAALYDVRELTIKGTRPTMSEKVAVTP
jgi:hypothetical protein